MLHGQRAWSGVRHDAAPMLLVVFVLAAQLGPAVHLATHRPDHSHGPARGGLAPAEHHAAHRAGRPHDHPDADRGRRRAAHDRAIAQRPPSPARGEQARVDRAAAGDAPPSDTPIDDHGRESIAHLGLALLAGPPPPIVPPPSEAIAPPADARPRWHGVPSRPQPPARGPPAPRLSQLPAA